MKRIKRLAIILLQIIVSAAIIIGISIVLYTLWYRKVVPKYAIEERIYFDFSHSQPRASMSLICSSEKQWDKLNTPHHHACSKKAEELIGGNFYDFSARVKLSKSFRNMELAKSALVTKIVDCNGQTIAKSVRPLIVPYQSWISLQMESVLFFPLRVLGYIPKEEFTFVEVSLLDNYQEPVSGGSLFKAHNIELELHRGEIELQDFFLKISPRLSVISYWLLYHPLLSFVCGISLITALQIVVYFTIIVIALAYNTLSGNDIIMERAPILAERNAFEKNSENSESDVILDTTTVTWRINPHKSNYSDIVENEEEEEDAMSFVWQKKNN